jgi:hypothetical protein
LWQWLEGDGWLEGGGGYNKHAFDYCFSLHTLTVLAAVSRRDASVQPASLGLGDAPAEVSLQVGCEWMQFHLYGMRLGRVPKNAVLGGLVLF